MGCDWNINFPSRRLCEDFFSVVHYGVVWNTPPKGMLAFVLNFKIHTAGDKLLQYISLKKLLSRFSIFMSWLDRDIITKIFKNFRLSNCWFTLTKTGVILFPRDTFSAIESPCNSIKTEKKFMKLSRTPQNRRNKAVWVELHFLIYEAVRVKYSFS